MEDSPLRIEWINTLSAIKSLKEKWLELEDSVNDRTVYSKYDWIIPWYRCYAGTKYTDYGKPLIGLAWNRSELVGIAPMISSEATFGKIPVRRIDCAGYNQAVGDILVRDDMPEIIGLFVDSLIDEGNFQVVCLNGIVINSEKYEFIKGHIEGRGLKYDLLDFHSYAMADLRGGYESYWKSKSHNFRRQTNRIVKKIVSAGSLKVDRVNIADGRGDVAHSIARMFSIAESGWRARKRGMEEEHNHQPIMRDVVSRFARYGAVDLSILAIDSKDAAFTLALIERDIYYQIFVAHDEKFNNFSPGTYLIQEVFKVLPDSGIHTVSSHGGYEYKRRWATDIVPQSTICIFGRGITATLSYLMKFKLQRTLKRFKKRK